MLKLFSTFLTTHHLKGSPRTTLLLLSLRILCKDRTHRLSMQTRTKESMKSNRSKSDLVYASQYVLAIVFVGDINAQITLTISFLMYSGKITEILTPPCYKKPILISISFYLKLPPNAVSTQDRLLAFCRK